MAKLDTEKAKGNWEWGSGKNIFANQDSSLRELEREADKSRGITGKIVRFPVADGFAMYVVSKESPLTLQHIPFGDAYEIDYPHIRGLRLSDIKEMVHYDKMLDNLGGASGQ